MAEKLGDSVAGQWGDWEVDEPAQERVGVEQVGVEEGAHEGSVLVPERGQLGQG